MMNVKIAMAKNCDLNSGEMSEEVGIGVELDWIGCLVNWNSSDFGVVGEIMSNVKIAMARNCDWLNVELIMLDVAMLYARSLDVNFDVLDLDLSFEMVLRSGVGVSIVLLGIHCIMRLACQL